MRELFSRTVMFHILLRIGCTGERICPNLLKNTLNIGVCI